MYKINRVNEENIQSLLSLIEVQKGRNPRRDSLLREKIQRREWMYYLLENETSALAYAHWVQDPERDTWIRLHTIAIPQKKEEDILTLTEILMYTSETSFRVLYEHIFERAQVHGARFQRNTSSNKLKKLYRSLGYHLMDDDPQELWEKQFSRREFENPPEIKR